MKIHLPFFGPPRTSAPPVRDDGYGKQFTFNATGESRFTNFTASEIVYILGSLRSEDVMSTHFPEDGVE